MFEKFGSLSEQQLMRVFFKVFIGLSHMNAAGVIHRNLNMDNVFLVFEDETFEFERLEDIKIIDLIFATFVGTANAKGFCGSPT